MSHEYTYPCTLFCDTPYRYPVYLSPSVKNYVCYIYLYYYSYDIQIEPSPGTDPEELAPLITVYYGNITLKHPGVSPAAYPPPPPHMHFQPLPPSFVFA